MVVPDYQLSLAIGKEGQNARLAARLTGWRIDIRSDTEPRPTAAAPRPRRAAEAARREVRRAALGDEPCPDAGSTATAAR